MGLIDAANGECQSKQFSSGIAHAREALEQSGSLPGVDPAVPGSSAFVLAECVLSQHEAPNGEHDRGSLLEVGRLLDGIHVEPVAHFSGIAAFPGFVDVARARLALAENNYPLARRMAGMADPFFRGPSADASEKAALIRVESALNRAKTQR